MSWNNLNTAYANIQIAMCQGSGDSTILFTNIHVSKVCYSNIHTLSIVDLRKSQRKTMNPHKVPVIRFRSYAKSQTENESSSSVTIPARVQYPQRASDTIPPSRLVLNPETKIG